MSSVVFRICSVSRNNVRTVNTAMCNEGRIALLLSTLLPHQCTAAQPRSAWACVSPHARGRCTSARPLPPSAPRRGGGEALPFGGVRQSLEHAHVAACTTSPTCGCTPTTPHGWLISHWKSPPPPVLVPPSHLQSHQQHLSRTAPHPPRPHDSQSRPRFDVLDAWQAPPAHIKPRPRSPYSVHSTLGTNRTNRSSRIHLTS